MKRGIALAGALVALTAAALAAAFTGGSGPDGATAASHREAPLISLDPAADITDFFMFRSYEPGKSDKVALIMNVFPGGEPSSGPNYFTFDPSVIYSFNVDNDRDGKADDVRFDFRFETEIRGTVNDLGLPLSYVAIPPVTALDGAGSEGLGLRQSYSVTMTTTAPDGTETETELADGLFAVPSNVGPRTMPDYAALAAQGVYTRGDVRVFAGQRQDPFYIDLGAVFDTLNLRSMPINMLSAFNVQTIALEVPKTLLAPSVSNQVVGAYASTSRGVMSIRSADTKKKGKPVQVQRLANPLINETIIGTKDKDAWNASEPEDESQFLDYYLRPRLAAALDLLFLDSGCVPDFGPDCEPNPRQNNDGNLLANYNRTDLRNVLLQYNSIVYGAGAGGAISELLRLNLGIAPKPLAMQDRLTVLRGDFAGWPNGRRPKDDVTDVAIQVVGGPSYIEGNVGDGVNEDDAPLPAVFPFLSLPDDGRNYELPDGTFTPHENPAP